MLRRAAFFTLLILGVLAIVPPQAQAGCNASTYCPSSCFLSLTCSNGCEIACTNQPSPWMVSCTGSSTCSVGQETYDFVECDGNRTYCYPYVCSQGRDWLQCNNNEVTYCPGPGQQCT